MTGKHSVLLFLCLILITSCSDTGTSTTGSQSSAAKPVVHTTNYPLAFFAERIGGDRIDLHFLPGNADGDPAYWEPADDDIITLQAADLILVNGATYEKWRDRVSLPEAKVVDTSKTFSGDFMESGLSVTHSHGPDGEHSHAGTAITTWMDFNLAIWQAEEVKTALAELLPDHESDFEKRFEELASELDSQHSSFKEVGKQIANQPLVASHPIYQYFARRYKLDIDSVLWEPETVPDEAAMAELKEILAEHPAKWMIWEGEPAAESVAKLNSLGIKSIVIDPCGNRPESGDFLSVMRQNLANLGTISSE